MSRVIAIANQKGGVGKTTTAVNLGASLAAAEHRTLVIDLDPQANTTSGLGQRVDENGHSMYGVLLDYLPMSRATLRGARLPMLDVVPADVNLAGVEVELPEHPDWQYRLRRAVADVQHLYDFVLIDCPPSFSVLTLNALTAADGILIPLQPEYYALEGLSQVTDLVRLVQKNLNSGLRLEGIVLTMFDARLNLARQVEADVRQHFGGKVFRTRIPRNVALAEAPSFGMTVLEYSILSPGARAYLALARELIARRQRPAERMAV